MLAPALSPGDVIVLGNLAAHKMAGVAEATRAFGASLLYLPPTAPILTRLNRIFRAQGASAQSGRTHQGSTLGNHRRTARCVFA
jgi:transposase